jgi:hypothetical protein
VGLPDALPHLRRQAIGGTLDVEQLSDAIERFFGERRSGEVDVMEFASHMRPTKHLGDGGGLAAIGLVKRAEAGITIGMQEAAESGQVPVRVLASAIGRVAVKHRRRRRSGVWALIAQIDP